MRDSNTHPLGALMVGLPIPLFLGALLSDIAYVRTFQIQWTNFASWLIAGALVFGGIMVVIALVGLVRKERPVLFLLLAAAMWVLGFINALIHARDGWAAMPAGLILSVIVLLLALAAAWAGLSTKRRVEAL